MNDGSEAPWRDARIRLYRDGLLDDTLPFWLRHGVDEERGGLFTGLDRDGSVIDTDKGIWPQCRFAWLLATVCDALRDGAAPRQEAASANPTAAVAAQRTAWLEVARTTLEFVDRFGFDADGRMFFSVTRDGQPLRKRRYVFSEAFAAIAHAAYGRAAHCDRSKDRALELFRTLIRYHTTPGLLEPKFNPATRRTKGLAMPMIIIVTAQELRLTLDDPLLTEWIDRAIAEIGTDFFKPEHDAVLETVGVDGALLDTFDGRLLNPGHAIEAGWFVLAESVYRGGDAHLEELGLKIIDTSWRRGWDTEHGGMLYFTDVRGLPSAEYWHDMKFWWPHNEAVLANLLAFLVTSDEVHRERYELVHRWAYEHFPDSEHGEWFGYLHRDGTLSTRLKGNLWKGPFHLPRMQLYAWQWLEGKGLLAGR